MCKWADQNAIANCAMCARERAERAAQLHQTGPDQDTGRAPKTHPARTGRAPNTRTRRALVRR